jgi:hypothetical protein
MLSSNRSRRVGGVGLSAVLGLTLLGASPAAAAETQSGNAGGQVLQQQLRQRTAIVVPTGSAPRAAESHPGGSLVNVNTSVAVPVVVVFNIAQQCQQTTNSCTVQAR